MLAKLATHLYILTKQGFAFSTGWHHARLKQGTHKCKYAKMTLKAAKPTRFAGKPSEKVVLWLFTVRQYFVANNEVDAPDEQKTAYAASFFDGAALSWWQQIVAADAIKTATREQIRIHNHMEDQRAAQNPGYQPRLEPLPDDTRITTSWARFEEAMYQRFQAVDFAKVARERLRKCHQSKSVSSYIYAYNLIIADIPDMAESEKVYNFVSGLKEKVRIEVELKNPSKLDQAQQIAERVDEIIYAAHKKLPSGPPGRPQPRPQNSGGPPRRHQNGPAPMDLDALKRVLNAYAAHPRDGALRRGKDASNPPRRLTDAEREDLRRRGACFYCKQPGHLAVNCPQKGKGGAKRFNLSELICNALSSRDAGESHARAGAAAAAPATTKKEN